MKIVIDARMYGLENAGIGRYVINLIDHIGRFDQLNRYYILLRKRYFDKIRFVQKNFEKVLADYPHYSWQEQVFLPIQLIKLKPDLVHFLHFNLPLLYPGRFVVTIHDLTKHQSRGSTTTSRKAWFYWLKYGVYRLLILGVIKRAWKIITPSHFWREKIDKKKTVVIYEGVDDKLKIKNLKLKIADKNESSYLLYVGQLYPHKNVITAVKAAKELKIKLKIACSRNVFSQRFERQVKELGGGKWVEMLGFVPDEKLRKLYQGALVFVFPSLYEGFGLPGLEAMTCGCPVVAARASCLPEIYGKAAVYFEPKKVKALIEAIKVAVKNREKLKKLGQQQVKKYSWKKAAQETIKLYESSSSL
jgi:glycosyltransferase involved in cell wall biosynthesis